MENDSSWLTSCVGVHITEKPLPTYGDNQKQLKKQLYFKCGAVTRAFTLHLIVLVRKLSPPWRIKLENLTHLLKKPKQTNKTYGKSLMQCKYQTVGFLKETELLRKLLMAYNSNSFSITNQKDGTYLLVQFCGKILQKCYPWMWKVSIFTEYTENPEGIPAQGIQALLLMIWTEGNSVKAPSERPRHSCLGS